MRRLVIDAPLLLSWFSPNGAGRALRTEYEAGDLAVVAPVGLPADVLELIARRGAASADRLGRIAMELDRLGFELRSPRIGSLSAWLAKGLPANRAAYPALAATLDLRLATNDPELARIAAGLVVRP